MSLQFRIVSERLGYAKLPDSSLLLSILQVPIRPVEKDQPIPVFLSEMTISLKSMKTFALGQIL